MVYVLSCRSLGVLRRWRCVEARGPLFPLFCFGSVSRDCILDDGWCLKVSLSLSLGVLWRWWDLLWLKSGGGCSVGSYPWFRLSCGGWFRGVWRLQFWSGLRSFVIYGLVLSVAQECSLLLVFAHVLGKCLTSRAGCILQFLCFSFFSVSPAGWSCAELGWSH